MAAYTQSWREIRHRHAGTELDSRARSSHDLAPPTNTHQPHHTTSTMLAQAHSSSRKSSNSRSTEGGTQPFGGCRPREKHEYKARE
eukprot:2832315-Pleurochrysis_carterae.AAC.1